MLRSHRWWIHLQSRRATTKKRLGKRSIQEGSYYEKVGIQGGPCTPWKGVPTRNHPMVRGTYLWPLSADEEDNSYMTLSASKCRQNAHTRGQWFCPRCWAFPTDFFSHFLFFSWFSYFPYAFCFCFLFCVFSSTCLFFFEF